MRGNSSALASIERRVTTFVCDGCGRRLRLYTRGDDPVGLPRFWQAHDEEHYCDATACATAGMSAQTKDLLEREVQLSREVLAQAIAAVRAGEGRDEIVAVLESLRAKVQS